MDYPVKIIAEIPSTVFGIYPTLEFLQQSIDNYFEYRDRIEIKELTYSNGN